MRAIIGIVFAILYLIIGVEIGFIFALFTTNLPTYQFFAVGVLIGMVELFLLFTAIDCVQQGFAYDWSSILDVEFGNDISADV